MEDEAAVLKEQLCTALQQLAQQARHAEERSAANAEEQRVTQAQRARIDQLEQELRSFWGYKQQCEDLQGTVEALQQECHRLRSARTVLDMEVREAREAAEARSREVSQLQSNLAWHKSRVDEQNAQLRILKQQLVDLEEEVWSVSICEGRKDACTHELQR
jgi:predicted RNase H-like nuclease (RuvC/YqgF family)